MSIQYTGKQLEILAALTCEVNELSVECYISDDVVKVVSKADAKGLTTLFINLVDVYSNLSYGFTETMETIMTLCLVGMPSSYTDIIIEEFNSVNEHDIGFTDMYKLTRSKDIVTMSYILDDGVDLKPAVVNLKMS